MIIRILRAFDFNLQFGGDHSMLGRIALLSALGHNIKAVTLKAESAETYLKSEHADEVWVSYYMDDLWAAALRWNPEKTVIFLTDAENFPLWALEAQESMREKARLLRDARVMSVASPFMKTHAKACYPWVKTRLDLAPIKPFRACEFLRPKQILFVNPAVPKGVRFAELLARRLPHFEFAFIEAWNKRYEKPAGLENISVLPFRLELEDLFREGSLLIMPSLWREAFGRVALEAMSSGMRVLSSDKGALTETVGRGGEALELFTESWMEKIEETLRSPASFRSDARGRFEDYERLMKAHYLHQYGRATKLIYPTLH